MRWKTDDYTGWGRVLEAKGEMVRPEKMADLKAILKTCKGPAVGQLRSYGDVALNDGGAVINLSRLNRLIGFDPRTGILKAEAGATIGEIARVFSPKGWMLPVMPGTGFVTLGGAIANDVHGKSHHIAGSFGQHAVAMELMMANGRQKRLTPDGTPDLFRATIGGLGQTGIILTAEVQLIEGASEIVDVRENRAENLDAFLSMLASSTATYSVGWIDTTARGASLGRGILEEGEFREYAKPLQSKKAKSIPRDAPGFLLSAPVVRVFNEIYYHRVPASGRRHDRTLQDFFFPLDRIHTWNRLYGKPGFHQFQCVLPDDSAKTGLRQMMDLIATSRLASPLAVLKRLGPGRGGMMSFPMSGYTLAIDFPNRTKTAGLLAELEAITLKAGGRIYFAKDALMRRDSVSQMYDEHGDFARITNEVDPDRVFETNLVRRLNLRGSK
jgi:decaprenylphospho-beta-D-ribofuranose 2-oxidase